jgi:hypothetical protein
MMLLAHRDTDTGEVDQEIKLEWDGPSGWTIVLRVREFEKNTAGDDMETEASAALEVDEARALAAVLIQMADLFERER